MGRGLAIGLAVTLGACLPASAAAEPEERAKNLIVMVDSTVGGVDVFGAGIVVGATSTRLYVATADHVVRSGMTQAEAVRIGVRSLPGETLEGLLLQHHEPLLDLAVLAVDLTRQSVPLEPIPFALLGDPARLDRGAVVHHVGQPNGKDWWTSPSDDKVTQIVGHKIGFEAKSVHPGNSGGGLFDERWHLVGMVIADETLEAEAVGITTVLNTLEQWGYPVGLRAAETAATVGTGATGTSGQTGDAGSTAGDTSRTVPDVEGGTLEQARQRIVQSGLALGRVGSRTTRGRKGTVYQQEPPAGQEVAAGSRVDVWLVEWSGLGMHAAGTAYLGPPGSGADTTLGFDDEDPRGGDLGYDLSEDGPVLSTPPGFFYAVRRDPTEMDGRTGREYCQGEIRALRSGTGRLSKNWPVTPILAGKFFCLYTDHGRFVGARIDRLYELDEPPAGLRYAPVVAIRYVTFDKELVRRD